MGPVNRFFGLRLSPAPLGLGRARNKLRRDTFPSCWVDQRAIETVATRGVRAQDRLLQLVSVDTYPVMIDGNRCDNNGPRLGLGYAVRYRSSLQPWISDIFATALRNSSAISDDPSTNSLGAAAKRTIKEKSVDELRETDVRKRNPAVRQRSCPSIQTRRAMAPARY